jgi:hypothetical protein
MKLIQDVLRQWLPIAAVTTAFCMLVYVAVQQDLRHSANDPQIQMAEDGANALAQGGTAEAVLPSTHIDIAQSLAPFLIVFDSQGNPVSSSGLLRGRMPRPPAGVFRYVQQHHEDRITWQPEPAVRIASVIVEYAGSNAGFVLAGRSLREVEKRESQVGLEAGAAWVGILGVSLVLIAAGRFIFSDKTDTHLAQPVPG